MPTAAAYRAKIGVITPSTNTTVEYDVNTLPIPGLSFHVGRIYLPRPRLSSDDEFRDLIDQVMESMETAIRDVTSAEPDHLMLGMSAPVFWGGLAGSSEFKKRASKMAGMPVTTPAEAVTEGLKALGVKRIGVLTPYQPVADENVHRFLTESGFDVKTVIGLKVPSATEIAKVEPPRIIEALREIDSEDLQALVQLGADLSAMKVADEGERWLKKPVIAVNVTTTWLTLRRAGIKDQFPGFGPLFRDH